MRYIQHALPARAKPPNKALHLTPVNVAKMYDYNHLFRIAKRVTVVVGRR